LNVQETTVATIDQRTQRVEARLQGVEDGIHAILNILQARPPVNNQVAVAPAAAIEETKEEETKEEAKEGKSFLLFQFFILFFIVTHLVSLRSSTETGQRCPAGANASARHGSGVAQDPCLAARRMGLEEPGRLRSPPYLGELEGGLDQAQVYHGGYKAQAAGRRRFSH
jgi:hypothetical protein